ncbi:hypothetical protein MMC10_010526 [Thelotrema lepadinum]|nr:hypothetical protein [Thelotrema lepadinum]
MASPTVFHAVVFLLLLALTTAEEDTGSEEKIVRKRVIVTHGIMAVIAWVVLAPIGVILLRNGTGKRGLRVHGIWQTGTFIVFTAAAGMGIWLAQTDGKINQYHPVIGLVLLGLATLQPLGGVLAHSLYKKKKRPTFVGTGHAYLGFIVITLGMINGGLGLNFSRKYVTDSECIAYGVIVTVLWICFVTYLKITRGKAPKKEEMAEEKSSESETPHGASLGDTDQITA